MLGRLFCLGGGRDADWAAHAQYGAHTSSARARVLELVAEELEERFAALPPGVPATGRSASHSQDASLLSRRLYNANLPSVELNQCRDLLRKLAAIDAARVAAETDQQQLSAQLKSAEAAHRQAEFARARAEAIATARGEALMHAQQQTCVAQQEKMQLEEVLRLCVDRLGLDEDLLPLKHSPLLEATPGGGNKSAAAASQSLFSKQQLAAVAASVSRLPRQSIAALTPLHEHSQQQRHWQAAEVEAAHTREQLRLRQEEEEAQLLRQLQQEEEQLAQRYRASQERLARQQQHKHELERQQGRRSSRPGSRQSSRPGSRQSSRDRGNGGARAQDREERAARASLDADQLSGFTVYTNEMEEAVVEGPDEGEVVQPEPAVQQEQARHVSAHGGDGLRDSHGSGVQWRSISSAALSSRSATSEREPEEADEQAAAAAVRAEQEQQQRARQSHGSLPGSRSSSQQQLRGSQEQSAAAATPGQQQASTKLVQHARQLSRLVLPDLGASQLDSLVRIGASMQSPDQHLQGPVTQQQGRGRGQERQQSPVEVVQQLLPPGWEQAVAQLDSAVNPLQSNANAEAFLSELHAEWMRQSCGGGDGRLGGMPGSKAPGYDFYMDSKFPGAGTWVSPSLAAMLAHKKGYNPLLDGGEPSPPSHIKAVFGTTEDREFYGPMAAHLNRKELPGEARQAAAPKRLPAPAPRPPPSASAESIRGPQRQQPPSNHSSFDDGRSADQFDYQQQAAGAAARQAAAALPPPAGMHHASVDQPPQRRQAALRSGFQPMGMHAQSSLALSQQQQQPRRSSVAISELGEGGGRRSADGAGSQRASGAGIPADENMAAAGLGKASLRGSGLPPRGQQQQQQQAVPATKRSLDSMRSSVGGGSGAGAHSIQASLNAVDAAMAALRNANPHISREQPPPPQQQHGAPPPRAQQQHARVADSGAGAGVGASRGGLPRPGVHHIRTRSLPDVPTLDLPLQQQAAAAGAGPGRRGAR